MTQPITQDMNYTLFGKSKSDQFIDWRKSCNDDGKNLSVSTDKVKIPRKSRRSSKRRGSRGSGKNRRMGQLFLSIDHVKRDFKPVTDVSLENPLLGESPVDIGPFENSMSMPGHNCRWMMIGKILSVTCRDGYICRVQLLEGDVIKAVSACFDTRSVFFATENEIYKTDFSPTLKSEAKVVCSVSFKHECVVKFLHSSKVIAIVSNNKVLSIFEYVPEQDFYMPVIEKTMSWKDRTDGFTSFVYSYDLRMFGTVFLLRENGQKRNLVRFFDDVFGESMGEISYFS